MSTYAMLTRLSPEALARPESLVESNRQIGIHPNHKQIATVLDAVKVDSKFFKDESYCRISRAAPAYPGGPSAI